MAAIRSNITRLVFVALFAAFISAGAFIVLPVGPVPVVLQNFFSLLSGLVLGPFLGAAAVGLFIAAGAIGLPVFANNGSPMGLARIIGPTGGYLLGYLLGALTAGFIAGFLRQEKIPVWRIVLAVIAGVLVVYLPGLAWLKFTLNLDWKQTCVIGFVPFIACDAIKGVVAGLLTRRLRKAAKKLLE